MSMITVKVKNKVAYDKERPTTCYTGTFSDNDLCPHLIVDTTRVNELLYRGTKCTLFNRWLGGLNKCDECLNAIKEFDKK